MGLGLLLATLLSVLSVGNAQFAWSTQTQQCARMDGDQSNIWADQQNGFRWNFDLHIRFPLGADPDFMEKTVRVKFLRPLTILRVEPQGSVSATNGGVDFVEVEVNPSYVGHEYFSIQGFREGGGSHEDLLSPEITCVGGTDVPPPMPPGPPSCDLGPLYGSYPLGGSREAGSDVTLKLSKWTPFRVFSLVYFSQEGLLVSKPQGITIISNPQRFQRNGDDLIGFTFSLDPQGSAGLRCDGHPACIEFEAKPAPHHRPHITCIDSPPPTPPIAPPSLPPPAPQQPVHVLSPPPPPVTSPPALARVTAPASCELGGSARVHGVRDDGATTNVRIVVNINRWVKGAIVTLGLDGSAMVVSRTIHASAVPNGPTLDDAMRSFSFSLGEEPLEDSAFAVILDAQHWLNLVSMACSSSRSQSGSSAFGGGGSSTGSSYGDDASSAGGTDAAGGASYGGVEVLTTPTTPSSPQASSGGSGSTLLAILLVVLIIGGAVFAGLAWYQRQNGSDSPLRGALKVMGQKKSPNLAAQIESIYDAEDDDIVEHESPRHLPSRPAVDTHTMPHRMHGLSLDMDDDDMDDVGPRPSTLILSRPEVI